MTSYHNIFAEVLIVSFLSAFNSLASNPNGLLGKLEAHITVNPKEGKNPTQVTNYRLIFLLNVDLKIFAKILANRLSVLMPSLVTKKSYIKLALYMAERPGIIP